MLSIGKESNLDPSEVMEKAVAFFGPPGIGLNTVERGECCARFEGAGGHVFVQADEIQGRKGSQVSVQGREWHRHIKQFIGQI